MPVDELKCPNCGASVHPTEGQRLFRCQNCSSDLEYDDDTIHIHIVDAAEILKYQVERERIAADEREKKRDRTEGIWLVIIGLAMIFIPMLPGIYYLSGFDPGYQRDYQGRNYKEVVNELRGKGFWFVSSKAVEDLKASETSLEEMVSYVMMNSSQKLPDSAHFWDRMEVIYHKMPENPPVALPADSGGAFRGWKLQDAANKMYSVGFATVDTKVENDLDSVTHGDMGKVTTITINGETDWVLGGTRKTYHRDDEVIIYYHGAKNNAKASPPEGNQSILIGQDYHSVQAEFEEAGFTNIETKGNGKLTSEDLTFGLVTQVTVDGDTEWSYGLGGMLRKTYARNVKVVITYNSVKE